MPHVAVHPSPSASRLDPARLPRHVGIIMDGNGRWATQRGKGRSAGHREGLEASKRVVAAASRLGVGWLSLYTFSTENWKRATEEVSFLMGLIKHHLRNEYNFYRENQIRIVHSGDLAGLPADVQDEIRQATADTADFGGMVVNLAINYGGRDELLRAFARWRACAGPERGGCPDEDELAAYLDLPELPDADLIIRTGGERRISNFLLWKSAYAELYFSDRLWPDWGEDDLAAALLDFQGRSRRFGAAP